MATNIEFVEYIGEGRLLINVKTREWLAFTLSRGLMASQNFVDDASCVEKVEGLTEELLITKPFWIGSFSGSSVSSFYKALAETEGAADLLLTWEGGESHTGLRVVDGTVTEHEVVFTLGAEVKS